MTRVTDAHRAGSAPRGYLLPAALALFALASTVRGSDAALLERYVFDDTSLTQWKLPGKLAEISGLATDGDGRLFAHDDERAIVYELDYEHGNLVKAFALGEPTVRGDFEGIAIGGRHFWLVTSDGTLYQTLEGSDGERMAYSTFDTGVGRRCEVEGLEHDPERRLLLLVCKRARVAELENRLTVFAWSIAARELRESATLSVPLSRAATRLDTRQLHPSGIVRDPASGHLLIVAAAERALLELAADGVLINALRLPLAKRHRQAEGIALTPDGRLVLADEGAGRRARLGLYSPRSANAPP